jgi:sulfatase modifying factor 1
VSKKLKPRRNIGRTPRAKGNRASGRWWLIGLAAVAIAATAVLFKATRPEPTADASPTAAGGFIPTSPNPAPPPGLAPEAMVWIPGGEFSMGSDTACESLCGLPGVIRDAAPIHRVYVDGFWMDKAALTNDKFEEFVKATGYVTVAERTPTREEFPTAPPENLVAGSTIFTPTPGPVPLKDHYQWWRYQEGANWRHPGGPDTDLQGKAKYPVVHIAYPDAVAYAKWAGKRLPT